MPNLLQKITARDQRLASFKHYELLVHAYVVVLLISNLMGPKPTQIGPFIFSGAQLLFPITYIFSDIFTEVYGYGGSRRAIWIAFLASVLMGFFALFMVWLPAAPAWPKENQRAFQIVFGNTTRGILASLGAFWIGEFVNSYVMARMKLWTGGRWLWTRTLGSTVAGQAVDSLVVTFGLFAFTLPVKTILVMAVSGYLFKVLYEAVVTPLTYAAVAFLKRSEGVDVFDEGTNFSPFVKDN
ncbi:MAG: queuosine precursor transporter [Holophagaceae bacterium]|uniref:Probable queuosine precursor transporter n=1 Tax=Candidatus Geothrix skivensis TaxID=2954439 RepID=A0A9D7SHB8_9BACT|nr:queuosine precursor transporter [Candidatus Geothrix skivensis]